MSELPYGDLQIIGMRGCEDFTKQVDKYVCEWRGHETESYSIEAICPRFGTGEAKAILHESQRGKDVYIICDCFNYGVEYKMYGK